MAEAATPRFITVSFMLGLALLLCGFFAKSWIDDVNSDRKLAKGTADRVLVLETQYLVIRDQLYEANRKLDKLTEGK